MIFNYQVISPASDNASARPDWVHADLPRDVSKPPQQISVLEGKWKGRLLSINGKAGGTVALTGSSISIQVIGGTDGGMISQRFPGQGSTQPGAGTLVLPPQPTPAAPFALTATEV